MELGPSIITTSATTTTTTGRTIYADFDPEIAGFDSDPSVSPLILRIGVVRSSMDLPHLSPPAISIHDVNSGYDQPRLIDRFHHKSPLQSFPPSGPVPIPTKSMSSFVPPPLPPPSRIADLEDGQDTAWFHANSQEPMAARKLAPISPSSSLFSGHHHHRPEASTRGDPMMLDDLEGRQSRIPAPRSPEAQIRIEPPPPMDDGFRNSVGTIPGTSSM